MAFSFSAVWKLFQAFWNGNPGGLPAYAAAASGVRLTDGAKPEAYLRFSPVSLVGNIETPTMVMVGTADMRTPLSEAKQLYGALKIRGIDTALVEIPDASHSIAKRPSQMMTKVDHVLAWFEKYRQ